MRALKFLALAALLAPTACDDHLFPNGEASAGAYPATFAGVEQFFGDHCEGCHPSLNPFDLTTLENDVAAGTGAYVVAGNPEASELWLVLIDASDNTALMPLGGEPLDSEVVQGVYDWIANGASLE